MPCTKKSVSFICNLLLLFTAASGQTSGPSQPEVQSFQPVSVTNMVEPSTGEFQYNIPLFSIGGYPINISYNSRVGMEQEAGMAGLGFSINYGYITTQVRGLPDYFMGDVVVKRVNMKPNITLGLRLGTSFELVGLDKKKAKKLGKQAGVNFTSSAGFFFNNTTGFGIDASSGVGVFASKGGASFNGGVGINSSSQQATSVNPYCGFSYQYKKNLDKDVKLSKEKIGKYKLDPMKIKTTLGASAGISFNAVSYSPKIELPFSTLTLDFSFKAGFAWAFTELGGEISGYRIEQKLETNTISSPAYGFLYAEQAKNTPSALMDFNREQDGIMTENKPNLPFAFATPDVYSVAAQGVGGEFILNRNNVFTGFDPQMSSGSHSGGLEAEWAAGYGAHVGLELRYGAVRNTTGKWISPNNRFLQQIDFISPVNPSLHNSAVAEEVYFKNPNDVMFNNHPIFGFSDFRPFAPKLSKYPVFGGGTKPTDLTVQNASLSVINATSFVNQQRDNRLNAIQHLTAEKAAAYGVQKQIPVYTLNQFSNGPTRYINRTDGFRKPHHLSELVCTKNDGMEYHFNIPAYNIIKREISYSINEDQVGTDYETSYIPDYMNVVNNEFQGKDEFISVTETPAYAHSFLLGCVLSPNYIDVDDNGPSPNDIGDYVQFNYALVQANYYWRGNNDPNKAAADPGGLAEIKDGKAFISEGEKEIWALHSMRSKTEEARYYYSPRNDAYDLKDNSKKLQRLDSILIYTLPELNGSNPQPYKRIYFEYDSINPLCKRVYNNPAIGKLTLKSLYFKNGSSNKGKWSAYRFGYSAFNPDYDSRATDRWGNYKPPNTPQSGLNLDSKYFPYVNQESRTTADKYASAWLLTDISLPSGGNIHINYEAHDYAYVQNKAAMIMTKVVGTSEQEPGSVSGLSNLLYNGNTNYNYLVFKLKTPFNAASKTDADWQVRQKYFTDQNDLLYGRIINGTAANLYGRFRVSLLPSKGFGDEDVPMFLDAGSCGAFQSVSGGPYDYGFVKLKNTNINQVATLAMQVITHSFPQILFGMDADPSLSAAEDMQVAARMLLAPFNMAKNILQTGPYRMLRNKNAASSINTGASFIRVYNPDSLKIGGAGSRVKNIVMNDNWQQMTGNTAPNSSYSIHYKYTKTVNGQTISSGVASYEPETGGDENPSKQPIHFTGNNVLMKDDNNFLTTPFGESLFPTANIMYSEVTTTQNPVTTAAQTGAGFTRNEYYTSYDFPTRVAQTRVELKKSSKFKLNLLKLNAKSFMVASQGYSVITNDMHGKPKSEAVYGERGNLVSAKYYRYRTNRFGQLDNFVPMMRKDGQVFNNQPLGITAQFTADPRWALTSCFVASAHGNADVNAPPPPGLALSVWAEISNEKKSYASFEISKHVHMQGILDSVIVVEKGATVYTKNRVWDEKTGDVLLTSTINEYKDPVFNFTYPAHWVYSGMGLASDNISACLNGSLSDFTGKLHTGDILGVNGKRYVVRSTTPLIITGLYLNTGTLNLSTLLAGTRVEIIKSGKKNLATTPVGHITALANPVQNGRVFIDAATRVTDADAVEYTNLSQIKCADCNIPVRDTVTTCNKVTIRCNNWEKRCDTLIQTCTRPNIFQQTTPLCNCDTIKISCRAMITGNAEWVINQNTVRCDTVIVRGSGTSTQQTPSAKGSATAPQFLLTSMWQLAPWQNLAAYKFVNDRTQNFGNADLRRDGYITRFVPFWQNNAWTKTRHPLWQFTQKVSLIDHKTRPVEWRNPLEIYSSVQYSNFNGLVNATATNARYHENLFESFEDDAAVCDTNHYTVFGGATPTSAFFRDNSTAHTGYYSARTYNSGWLKFFPADMRLFTLVWPPDKSVSAVDTGCNYQFTLLPGKKYILSAWVKEPNAANTTLNYTQGSIGISFTGSSNSYTGKPEGQIVNGWQRIETSFTMPNVQSGLKLYFSPNTYFDDIRIFPAEGNMKSYVYSIQNYLLMAILDENNYAAFYEYDQERQLKRVKKETEKGIVTIQEINAGAAKQ